MIYVASEKPWNKTLVDRLNDWSFNHEFKLLDRKEDLNEEFISSSNPQYIFFPHWSHMIPKSIYEKYECVVFHMTDLPYGRGGSPLQNLIVRGHKKTKISALKVEEGLDTGPIYLKSPLSLEGTAKEIFERADLVIEEMIKEIVTHQPKPVEQKGEVVEFKRRKPEEGCMNDLKDINSIFDYIRMLDAPTYPNAFIELEHFRIEFSNAQLKEGESIEANVRIIKK